jgi:hypothetical protein
LYWFPPMKTTAAASKIPNMQPIPMTNQDRREFLVKFILKGPYGSTILLAETMFIGHH